LLKDVIRLTLVNFHKADKFPSEHEWTVISQLVHYSPSAAHDAVFSVASSARSKMQPTFCRDRITQQCVLHQERSTPCSKRWNKKLVPNSWLVVLFLADNDVSADTRGVTWNSLPQEIQLVRKCLLLQLTQRFAPNGSGESSSLIWTRAALCHPKGKMLNWLSQQSRDAAIADFRALVLQYSLVADPAPAASAAATLAPISKPSWLEWDDQIPVRRTESCRHSSQGQPGDNIDPVESELTEWFQFQSPRAVGVKDTLLWWQIPTHLASRARLSRHASNQCFVRARILDNQRHREEAAMEHGSSQAFGSGVGQVQLKLVAECIQECGAVRRFWRKC